MLPMRGRGTALPVLGALQSSPINTQVCSMAASLTEALAVTDHQSAARDRRNSGHGIRIPGGVNV